MNHNCFKPKEIAEDKTGNHKHAQLHVNLPVAQYIIYFHILTFWPFYTNESREIRYKAVGYTEKEHPQQRAKLRMEEQ